MNKNVKIVHLGLGAFFKAHVAWYTYKTSDWQIAAFTGRSPNAAEELRDNGFKYKLITKAPNSDQIEIVDSVVEAFNGNDIPALNQYITNPNVAIVTITITEFGYNLNEDGMIARLLNALEKRFARNGKPIAIVPCDNLTQNGTKVRELFNELSKNKSEAFRKYLLEKVSIVSTSVDRITPKSEISNQVITEPYSAWVLQGDFPAGRPKWEFAGAKFVDDIKPFENRKLWLLNGAHSLLAYMGLNRGFETVSDAIANPEIREAVLGFWKEASEVLKHPELDLDKYQSSLLDRFSNPKIEHKLAQIAIDGSIKLRERIIPVIKARMASGSSTMSCKFVLAQWVEYVASSEFKDANQIGIQNALESPDSLKNLISILDSELSSNEAYVESIAQQINYGKKNHAKTTI